LISRAHAAGVPYLPIEHLNEASVHAWTEFLKPIAASPEGVAQSLKQIRHRKHAAYLVTPSRSNLSSSYVPPFQPIPEGFDHQHSIDTYTTHDDLEVVYCTLCGAEW
jgi:hypothetical protein